MRFSKWLRQNAEHYLMADAQDRIARQKGFNPPNPPRGLKDVLWLRLLIPIYHAMPWALKRTIMNALPGSHKKHWPRKNFRPSND